MNKYMSVLNEVNNVFFNILSIHLLNIMYIHVKKVLIKYMSVIL